MKRIFNLISALLLAAFFSLMPIMQASAATVNLISNPSVEQNVSGNTNKPLDWQTDKWGTNTTTFTYKKADGQNGTRSLYVNTTKYTSGDAKWFFTPITAVAGDTYSYSEYYKSSVYTDVLAQFIDNSGNSTYKWLTGATKSANNWKKLTTKFAAPAGTAKVTVLHILSAVGHLQTDNFSLTDTTVVTPPTSNVVPNPSLETVSATNSNLPDMWQTNKSRTNTTSFTYNTTGHSGNRSVTVNTTAYTSGDAYWSYPEQAVTGGKIYEFSDYYKATVDTYVYAEVTLKDGSQQWLNIGTALHSPDWNHFDQQFTMPANAVSAMVYQSMSAVGTLTTDDYKLNAYNPTGFTEGMVSVTFDDALRSVYTNGLPIMDKYGIKTTQYFLSGYTNDPYYMTTDMMLAFKNDGHEIGSHTVTHADLTTLSNTDLMTELRQSQSDLTSWLGVTPTDFASPHGAYNSDVINAIKQVYRSHRSVDVGFNSKDNFDIYNIKVQNIVVGTTPAQVMAWVNQAKADHTWLVLVYHSVDDNDANVVDSNWNTHTADLDAEFSGIKASGISVKTVDQALNSIVPQL